MLPPDLQAALGGGGAPQGAGLPPELMAALGGGGAPEGALHGGNAAEGDPEEAYREALDALEEGMKADTDEGRIQAMMKCATAIQGELANSQKGMDAAMGGKFDPAQQRRMQAPDQAY